MIGFPVSTQRRDDVKQGIAVKYCIVLMIDNTVVIRQHLLQCPTPGVWV